MQRKYVLLALPLKTKIFLKRCSLIAENSFLNFVMLLYFLAGFVGVPSVGCEELVGFFKMFAQPFEILESLGTRLVKIFQTNVIFLNLPAKHAVTWLFQEESSAKNTNKVRYKTKGVHSMSCHELLNATNRVAGIISTVFMLTHHIELTHVIVLTHLIMLTHVIVLTESAS